MTYPWSDLSWSVGRGIDTIVAGLKTCSAHLFLTITVARMLRIWSVLYLIAILRSWFLKRGKLFNIIIVMLSVSCIALVFCGVIEIVEDHYGNPMKFDETLVRGVVFS